MFNLLRPILLIIAILLTITPFIINPPAVSANKTLGNIKIAFFQARFNNTPASFMVSKADIESILFDYPTSRYPESLKSIILQDSSFRTIISGRAYDIVKLPYDVDLQRGRCDILEWSKDLRTEMQRQGVNLSEYDYFIYLFPFVRDCGYGLFVLGGNGIFALITGTPVITSSYVTGFLHELYHEFGLDHSSTYKCALKSIDNFPICQNEEYGDTSDIMGHTDGVSGLNGPHKYQLGWLYDLYKTIDSTGVQNVSVYDHHLNTSILDDNYRRRVKKIIKIPKYDTNQFYEISYNGSGAQIHLADDTPLEKNKIGNPVFRSTRLLNPHPGINIQIPFRDGDEFVDEINNIKVKQLNHVNRAYANLRIEMNSSPLPPPQISNVQCGSEDIDLRGRRYIPIIIDGQNLGGYDDYGGSSRAKLTIDGLAWIDIVGWNNQQIAALYYLGAPLRCNRQLILTRADGQVAERSLRRVTEVKLLIKDRNNSITDQNIDLTSRTARFNIDPVANSTFLIFKLNTLTSHRYSLKFIYQSSSIPTPSPSPVVSISPSPSPRVTEIKLQHTISTGRVTEQTISLPISTFNFSIDPSSHLTRFLFQLSDRTRVSPYYYVKYINQNTSASGGSGGLIINPEIRIDSVLTIN